MKKAVSRFLTFGLSVAMLCGLVTVSHAQSPSVAVDASAAESTYTGTYYNGITAESGTQLLGQIHDLIVETHTTYTSYDDCKTKEKISDPGLDGQGYLEFYTHETITSFGGSVGTANREHVWCQSLSNGLWGESGAGSDMHHIRPTESSLNSTRGNHKYGNVNISGAKEAYSKKVGGGQSKLGGYVSGDTFMPLDNVKGDAARIVMYVYTHYNKGANVGGTLDSKGSGTLKFTNIMSASTESDACKILLEWNELDPVDEIERKRNEEVFKIQHNRNPFIDHPEYAEAIWGDGTVTPNPDGGDGGGTTPETSAFSPITVPVAGTEYYMGMKIGDGQYHYIDGGFSENTYYLTTTTNIASAKKVTLEASGSDWLMKVDGKYLELDTSDGSHANPKFNAQQTTGKAWKWDNEHQIFTWDTAKWFLGTRNDKTFDTIGGCAWNYLNSDYLAVLGTYGTDTPTPPVDADQQKVEAALNGLQATRTITQTTTLETQKDGVALSWKTDTQLPNGITFSGNTITVSDDRPTTDTAIVFTVTGTYNGKTGTKTVTVTVKGKSGGTVTPPAGETVTLTITLDSFTLTDGYGFKTWSSGGVSGVAFIYGGSADYPTEGAMQFSSKKDSYYITNTTAIPGVITSVKATGTTVANGAKDLDWRLRTSSTAYGEVAGAPTSGNDQGLQTVTTTGSATWNVTDTSATYFALILEKVGNGSAGYLGSIEITYVSNGTQGGGEQGGGEQGGGEQGGGEQGGGEQGGTHTHSFTYEVFDEEYHLKSCTGCGEVKDEAEAHVYSDENDTTCDLCGYEREIKHDSSDDPNTGNTPSVSPEPDIETDPTPGTDPGTTPSNPNSTPSDKTENPEKKGCGGAIGGAGIAAALIIAAAALIVVMVEKKRQ